MGSLYFYSQFGIRHCYATTTLGSCKFSDLTTKVGNNRFVMQKRKKKQGLIEGENLCWRTGKLHEGIS